MSNYAASTTAEEIANDWAAEVKGRTFLITGATWGGIGAEAIRVIAKHDPALIVLAGRSRSKLDVTIANIKKEVPSANLRSLVLDLASFVSIRDAAAEVSSYKQNIDVLIDNAGVMACPYSRTKDGFEMQFGSNHLGHFLFTNLILEKLLKTSKPRVVIVSALLHHTCPVIFDDVNFANGTKYDPWHAYGQSKTANILFGRELAKRYADRGLSVFSLHPGVIETNLGRHVDFDSMAESNITDYWGRPLFSNGMKNISFKTLGQGASTTVYAALDPGLVPHSGSHLLDNRVNDMVCADYARDMRNAARLWELSEELVEQKF